MCISYSRASTSPHRGNSAGLECAVSARSLAVQLSNQWPEVNGPISLVLLYMFKDAFICREKVVQNKLKIEFSLIIHRNKHCYQRKASIVKCTWRTLHKAELYIC